MNTIEIKNEQTLFNNQPAEITVISYLQDGVLYRDPSEGPALIKYSYNQTTQCWYGAPLLTIYTLTPTLHRVYNYSKTEGDTIEGHYNQLHVSFWKVLDDGSKVVHREPSEGPAVYTVDPSDYSVNGQPAFVSFIEYRQDGLLSRPIADGPARIEYKTNKYEEIFHSWDNHPTPDADDIYKVTYAVNGEIHHDQLPAVQYLNQAIQHCNNKNIPSQRFFHRGIDYTNMLDQLAELGLEKNSAEWEFTIELLRS
ncbi:hypothetical protein [Aeromonas salmonicida]|uniref:hypothetical protein n=1 Tax=Aeromonas salmonicida TaxID=645 RepID=UPI003D2297F2